MTVAPGEMYPERGIFKTKKTDKVGCGTKEIFGGPENGMHPNTRNRRRCCCGGDLYLSSEE